MENILYQLKHIINELIDTEKEYAKLNEMYFHCSDLNDKRNYSEEKGEKIRHRMNELFLIIQEKRKIIGL